MGVQTSIQQRTSAQPAVQEGAISVQGTTPATARPPEVANRPESMQAEQAGRAVTSPSRPTEKNATTVAIAVAALAVVALFAAGLMRSPIERTLRRLAETAEDIRVPLFIPVTLVETVRELVADRRAMDAAMADRHPAK